MATGRLRGNDIVPAEIARPRDSRNGRPAVVNGSTQIPVRYGKRLMMQLVVRGRDVMIPRSQQF